MDRKALVRYNDSFETGSNPVPLPLKLTADWAEDGANIDLSNAQFDGLNSKGSGKMGLQWADWEPNFTADMQFSTLDYGQWKTLLPLPSGGRYAAPNRLCGDEQAENPLPKDVKVSLAVQADQVTGGAQPWKTARLAVTLADAALTVNKFNVVLPGESTLSLFGVISQGSSQGGLRFEGSMETRGKIAAPAAHHVRRIGGRPAGRRALAISMATFQYLRFVLSKCGFVGSRCQNQRFAPSTAALSPISTPPARGMEADVRLKDIQFRLFPRPLARKA